MSKSETNKFKKALEAKHVELTPRVRQRDGIAIEKAPDALDEVQFSAERELMTRNLERESKMLREVREALSRIQLGRYGICLNCEEEIGLRRLKAVPWTPLCLACQEQDDRRGGHGDADWLPARAA